MLRWSTRLGWLASDHAPAPAFNAARNRAGILQLCLESLAIKPILHREMVHEAEMTIGRKQRASTRSGNRCDLNIQRRDRFSLSSKLRPHLPKFPGRPLVEGPNMNGESDGAYPP
jgi:hypothetical protein